MSTRTIRIRGTKVATGSRGAGQAGEPQPLFSLAPGSARDGASEDIEVKPETVVRVSLENGFVLWSRADDLTREYGNPPPRGEGGAWEFTRLTPRLATVSERGAAGLAIRVLDFFGLDFDLVAARKELEQARRELGGSIPRITIRINTGVEQHQIIAEWVQGQWKKHLGLDIGLESQEWKTMLKALRQHDFDIMRMGGIASMPEPEDFVGDNYRKGSPNNQPGWSSDEYMALLEKQQHEPDRQKRNQYIYEMEKLEPRHRCPGRGGLLEGPEAIAHEHDAAAHRLELHQVVAGVRRQGGTGRGGVLTQFTGFGDALAPAN